MLTTLLRLLLLVGAITAAVDASVASRLLDPLHAYFFAGCSIVMLILFVHPQVLTGGTRG